MFCRGISSEYEGDGIDQPFQLPEFPAPIFTGAARGLALGARQVMIPSARVYKQIWLNAIRLPPEHFVEVAVLWKQTKPTHGPAPSRGAPAAATSLSGAFVNKPYFFPTQPISLLLNLTYATVK